MLTGSSVLPARELRYLLRLAPRHDVPARQRRQRLRPGPAVMLPPRLASVTSHASEQLSGIQIANHHLASSQLYDSPGVMFERARCHTRQSPEISSDTAPAPSCSAASSTVPLPRSWDPAALPTRL